MANYCFFLSLYRQLPGSHQGGAPNRAPVAAGQPDQHGKPGAHQAGTQTAPESGGRVQVPQAKARTNLQARGQGEGPQDAKHRTVQYRVQPEAARDPAEAAGYRTPQLGLHHHADGKVLKKALRAGYLFKCTQSYFNHTCSSSL